MKRTPTKTYSTKLPGIACKRKLLFTGSPSTSPGTSSPKPNVFIHELIKMPVPETVNAEIKVNYIRKLQKIVKGLENCCIEKGKLGIKVTGHSEKCFRRCKGNAKQEK